MNLTLVLLASSIPVVAAVIGSLLAAWRPPGATTRSMIQHFASGVVIAVVAGELLPHAKATHSIPEVAGGFLLGAAVMLGIRKVVGGHGDEHGGDPGDAEGDPTGGSHSDQEGEAGGAAGLVAIGVDIAIDGLLVGIAFSAGAAAGGLLTLGLSIELLSLGLAVTTSRIAAGIAPRRAVATATGLASLLIIGALVGELGLANASEHVVTVVLSFGCAALLYLATEELLVEAHEVEETTGTTAAFFAGFLVVLVLGMAGG